MKKFLTLFFILLTAAPVIADVINPHFTDKDREIIREKRLERFKIRQRNNFILNICGKSNFDFTDKKEINSCKAELKKEYEATIKLVDKYAKENKKNEDKNLKNAAN